MGASCGGRYRTENGDGAGFADSWSAKTPTISRTRDFYLYGNDISRGLDVYKFSNARARSQRGGRWMSPQEAQALNATRPKVALGADTAFFRLLPQNLRSLRPARTTAAVPILHYA